MNDLSPANFTPVGGFVDSFRLWIPFAEGYMEQEQYLALFFERNSFTATFKFIKIPQLKTLLGLEHHQLEKPIPNPGIPTYEKLLLLGIGNYEKKLRKLWQDQKKRVDFVLVVLSLWIFHKEVPVQFQTSPYISLEAFGSRMTFGPYASEADKRRSQLSIQIKKNKKSMILVNS